MREYEFKDVQFLTADDKRKIIKAWERFLKNGCRWEDFTERLYHHLMHHCGFIAHYSRAGFYDTYFTEPDGTAHFLSQFDARGELKSIEYGGTRWISGPDGAYEDINRAMIDVGSQYIPSLIEVAKSDQKARDVERARALLKKHGLTGLTVESTEQESPKGKETPLEKWEKQAGLR
jgi:hypothetical protein